jgi:Fis family transcriptional regulator, factor for inversion stimulation protein
VRALLLPDAPAPLQQLCEALGVDRTVVPSVTEARRRLAQQRFDLVDGRVARPAPLEWEIRHRVEQFYDHLRGQEVSGLYDAVMREVERPLLAAALSRACGVAANAARDLGIDRGTLARRLRALGLTGAAKRESAR